MADQRLRIGIVGLGFGLSYMEQFVRSERGAKLLHVVGVCDSSAERLARGGAVFGCRMYERFDEMLADPAIEAIALFSGPVGRAELVSRAVRAGKHVMTTKPFELDPVAAARVLEEAGRLGRVVQLNSPAGQTPADIQQILDWQRDHDLGRAVAAHWHTWANYREKADGSWYDDPSLCPVAPIFRLGIYAINDLLYFLHEPREVEVMHSRLFTGRPTPDQALLCIRFGDGALASIFASFCVDTPAPYPDRLTLNFERGVVYKNLRADAGRDRIELELITRDRDGRTLMQHAGDFDTEECGGHHSYQWESFCRAALGGLTDRPTPPKHILDGVRVVAAMARAEATGQPRSCQ